MDKTICNEGIVIKYNINNKITIHICITKTCIKKTNKIIFDRHILVLKIIL